jgi:predicted nucleic acid-binding protein
MNELDKKIAIPSVHLAGLRELAFSLPQFSAAFRGLHQVRLVIDSNIILQELIWLTKRRANPAATTDLQEAIASGTVIAYAPPQLREEVEKHFSRIASEQGIPEERLYAAWECYQKGLNFCDAEPAEKLRVINPGRDPSDLPFIYLCAQVGAAAVVSNDKDIQAMGAATIRLDVMVHLREYARAKTIEVSISFGGTVLFIGIGTAAVELIAKLVPTMAQGFARLPGWLKLVLFIGTAVAVCHPKSRAAVVDGWHAVTRKVASVVSPLAPVLIEFMRAYQEEQKKAAESWAQVQEKLPLAKRVPLRNHVYAVCAAAKKPLLLEEIARKVRIGGYRSQARDFCSYLRRIMRQDPRFIKCVDGRWTIAMAQSA